jgi:hypothetical protein
MYICRESNVDRALESGKASGSEGDRSQRQVAVRGRPLLEVVRGRPLLEVVGNSAFDDPTKKLPPVAVS